MSTQEKNWRKKLDQHFSGYFDGAYYEKEDTNLGDELKDWIGDLLASQRSSLLEEIEKVQFSMNVDDYLPLIERWDGKNYDTPFNEGYKQAKTDILSSLTSKQHQDEPR